MDDHEADMSDFNHIEEGRARMVDIGEKPAIDRRAVATGAIGLSEGTIEAIEAGEVEKGATLTVARVAGIQAAKRTADALPLCHQLPLSSVDIKFELGESRLVATAEVATTAQTGVEMEALSAVSGALLCVWDMVKSLEKDATGQYPETVIEEIRIVEKRKGSPPG